MTFPIAGVHISAAYLVGVGFVVGLLGGFFGVGGSFLAGPALFAAGVPMNFVVGTDLAHIVGKSIVAARKHRTLGNIDVKLGAIMVLGTIAGVEAGAQGIQFLKRTAHVDWVVGPVFIVVLLGIAGFMTWESISTLRKAETRTGRPRACFRGTPIPPRPFCDGVYRQSGSPDQLATPRELTGFRYCEHIGLGNRGSGFCGRLFQWVFGWRRRLYPDAVFHLPARNPDAYRGRDRSF